MLLKEYWLSSEIRKINIFPLQNFYFKSFVGFIGGIFGLYKRFKNQRLSIFSSFLVHVDVNWDSVI